MKKNPLRELWRYVRGRSPITVIAVALAFAALVADAIFVANSRNPVSIAVMLAAIYLCAVVLVFLFRWLWERQSSRPIPEQESLGGGIAILQKMPLPLLLTREDGTVIWKNAAMQELEPLAGEADADALRLTDERKAAGAEGYALRYAGRNRQAYAFPLSGKSKERGGRLYAVILEDRQALYDSEERRKRENPLIAYLQIDNLDDVLRLSGAASHQLMASIGEELNKFASSLNGLLLEMEKDKYVLLFSEEHLQSLCRSRFEILDRVAAIHVGEGGAVTVTLSIGVGEASGSIAEREQSAQSALTRATQDGGACAMVKFAGRDYVKYGGNTKAVQSSSKVRSRIEGAQLLREIENSTGVLIMGHALPDYDCLASCVAAACLALSKGKPTHVVTGRAAFNISRAMALLPTIPRLEGVFVDASRAEDLIDSGTLLILTDVSNPALFEAPEIERAVERVAYIDHHRRTADFDRPPVLKYIDSSASSASELLSEMIEACLPKGALSVTEAELLLAGIILDTKSFTVNAGPRTFAAAQYLKSIGADTLRVQGRFFSQNMEEIRRQSAFEATAALYRPGVVLAVYRGDDVMPQEDVIAAKAADHLLTVQGVEAAFVIFPVGNTVRVKARSAGRINVQAILATLGGGGHYEAAALISESESEEAVEAALTAAIDRYFEEEEGAIG